jgi:hypothetical protein
MNIRRTAHTVKVGRRVVLAGALVATIASSVLLLGIAASAASADTAQQKHDTYTVCRSGGGSVRQCCHFIGGSYEAIYDEKGNLTSEWCTYHSDASHTSQSFSTAPPVYPNSQTGAQTSSTSSGGQSNAGAYGWFKIVEPVSGPPSTTYYAYSTG